MAALVADLDDIARIETGRLKLEPQPLPVRTPVEEALHSLRTRFEEKGQTLVVDLPDGLPEVMADPSRLVQVLTNLLDNARKYTPAGGQIEVSAALNERVVRLAVRDTGIGIRPEDQARLFTQFFRSDDDAVRSQPGWGLGLNVARQLIEQMGGRIGMQSRPEGGSEFWFTLPVAGQA
jgi:signal transduction histidine kinase